MKLNIMTILSGFWRETICYKYCVFQGFAIPEDKQVTKVPFVFDNQEYTLEHGSVVIAAITSCTNTSNPSVMLGAGK